VISRANAVDRFPGLRRRGLTGAAVWYDYVTPEADRLTFSWALAAHGYTAVLANHVDATTLVKDGRGIAGVKAIDRLTGRTLDVAARMVVTAAGGATDHLLNTVGLSAASLLLKAMNLVTSRDAGDVALGGRSASGRHLFLVPWRRRAVFGTWESSSACTPDDTQPGEHEVAAFIGELNEAFPALDLKRTDVTLVHRGLVPATGSGERVSLARHEPVREHGPGLISVLGTKYTTARGVAERVVNRVVAKLQVKAAPCRTDSTPLPGGHVRDVALAIAEARREYDALVPSDTIPHLVAAYGSNCREILELARSRAEWRTRLAADSPVIGAEIVWAARHEMAETLADAVLRRTPLGALGDPGAEAATAAAAMMAVERGWTEERTRQEVERLKEFYAASA
jgi:glycerol-3-phosphate dehydrogenase